MGGVNKVLERIEKIDKLVPDPETRAKKVLDALKEKYGDSLDSWDITCFCAEWLGMMSSAHPWLEESAKQVGRLVYLAHYERFEREAYAAHIIAPTERITDPLGNLRPPT